MQNYLDQFLYIQNTFVNHFLLILILHIWVGLVVLDWPIPKILCLNPPDANSGGKSPHISMWWFRMIPASEKWD